MESQHIPKTANFDPSDILSALESEEQTAHLLLEQLDPLATLSQESTQVSIDTPNRIPHESVLMRFQKTLVPKVKFSLYYLAISSVVFFVLLTATNWSSYTTLLQAYVNPNALKTSSADILTMLSKSKITVYANEWENDIIRQEKEDELKKKLNESNTVIHENQFSPKKLITNAVVLDVDFDITPYDNRIIIPKIGKNIPLVDVGLNEGFDFNHIENIFMKELEKGIVRYPGTARPGENGNAFIFGHSSNYPWMQGEYNSVFALLDELTFGDEIIVYYNQKKFTYVIQEKKIVKPGNVKILDRDPEKKELSLMTCWPVGTTLNRLIVFAELKK